jgi:2-polyprenyl-3-methyl-5-hydroxy-6-metoxy-1,4-benzoquinol methylase
VNESAAWRKSRACSASPAEHTCASAVVADVDDNITRSWQANALSWANVIRTDALESRRLVTNQAILDAVLAVPGQKVLDVGCGEGWLSRRLADAGRDVTAFDASPDLIREAQSSGGGVFLVLSYAEFADDAHRVGEEFDVVVCNFSLLDEDVTPVLAALRRVTRPRGHLLIQTVHPFAAAGERYQDGWREETFDRLPGVWSPMPWYFRTIGSWLRELRAAGWQILNCSEPLYPDAGMPASLILDATRAIETP